ncbi:class I SAM-dependent methyltransferase [Streptomyces sp. NPDC001680]
MHNEADAYGEKVADEYDGLYEDFEPPAEQITLLRELAAGKECVEIGAGTGRITIPLAASGQPVTAVDSSLSMLDGLRKKRGDLPVALVHADAAEYRHPIPAQLAFACFNTFFLMASTAAQRAFLRSAHRYLAPGGMLLIEVYVPVSEGYLPDGPNPGYMPERQSLTLKKQHQDTAVLFSAVNDQASQTLTYQEIVLADGRMPRVMPGVQRYHTPEQMDELADSEGLVLKDRWADWARAPYTEGVARKHISLYAPLP